MKTRDLTPGHIGRTIRVTLPLEGEAPPRPGDELRLRVRKAAPDRYFARPPPRQISSSSVSGSHWLRGWFTKSPP
mgnify:CR=1 FL=1